MSQVFSTTAHFFCLQSSEEGEDEEDIEESSFFRPTVSDNIVPEEILDTTTPTPFFPTFAPTTPSQPIILLTEQPRQRQREDSPRRLEIINLSPDNNIEEVKLGDSLVTSAPARARVTAPARQPPRVTVPSSRQSDSFRQKEINSLRQRPSITLGRSRAPTSPRTTAASLFQTNFDSFEPVAPSLPVTNPPSRQRVLSPQDLATALISRPETVSRPRVTPEAISRPRVPTRVSSFTEDTPEYEYEYYYEYLDDSGHVSDYDLVPLANKVTTHGQILFENFIRIFSGQDHVRWSASML